MDYPPQFRLQIEDQYASDFTSDPSHNIEGRDHLVTFQIVSNIGFPDNPVGAYVLAWEDSHPWNMYYQDHDFQDLVVEVTGIAPVVPEPSSVVLILLGISASLLRRLAVSRR
ncbi:PEP-CTERM sorting domain-containing protein [Aeoliella sp. SH292]|uniref:PEP-CTERM sorting domain-containing protein n=1 Tax=Aeoliella sp. SH292 TaxID=3454464 RepID=UPI003F9B3745